MKIVYLKFITSIGFFVFSASASALGQITVSIGDGAGEGFNDATAVAPLPNNPGTTRGEQRLNVFTQAANQWAAKLDIAGDPDIVINAQFNPLTCLGTSATLGSAGPTAINRDFPGATLTGTWYVVAEVNTITGVDNNAGTAEINAQFNSDLDGPAGVCLNGVDGWWYGIDDSVPIPAGKTALMPVVFHEIGHGLGFLTLTNTASGAFNGGFPDVWTHFMADANLPNVANATSFTLWKDLPNDAARTASAIDDPNLIWTGSNVTNTANGYLNPKSVVKVNTPAGIAGNKDAQPATFGSPVSLGGITADVVLGVDAVAPINDGCEPLTNAAAAAGKIVLVDRGFCNFSVKGATAQAANAIGVLVANNVATGLPPMGGVDPAVTLSALGISQAAGTDIKNNLGTGVNVTMGYDFNTPAGGNSGFVRLHAPNPRVAGSSVSHFSVDASPNLLMEPSLNQELFSRTDLTVPLFRDIHWPINEAGLINLSPTISSAPTYDAIVGTPKALNAISFGDPDAANAAITVNFVLASDTLTLNPSAGVVLTGSGSSTGSITGARNVLLAYVANGNVLFNGTSAGSVELDLEVSDNGNSGSGGSLNASTSAVINVTAEPLIDPIFSNGFE